ncbi:MAG: hypothetical protein OQL16_13130 [Gammaproteobacteria bacterium]|nr:hypothetical protein [Gammaproteobacteria bacterium]
MIELKNTLGAWHTDRFDTVLKNELEGLESRLLPLRDGLMQGSHVAEDKGFKVMIIDTRDDDQHIRIKIGVFFASIIAGCACADDPTPLDTCNEYCEFLLLVDKTTAQTRVSLVNG